MVLAVLMAGLLPYPAAMAASGAPPPALSIEGPSPDVDSRPANAPPAPQEDRPSRPGCAAGTITVTVQGEVASPGSYAVETGTTLSTLLLRSGGCTDNAFLKGAALFRESEKARRGKEFREIIAGIAARLTAAPGGGARREAFLKSLATLSPSGRIPVRLSHPRLLKGSPDDIVLEEGDLLIVPPRPPAARVAGAVASPGAVPLSGKAALKLKEVIEMAGGLTGDADPAGTWVLKADGAVRLPPRRPIAWNPAASRWEITAFTRSPEAVEPGDTVVVPAKPEAFPWPDKDGAIRRALVRITDITGTVLLP